MSIENQNMLGLSRNRLLESSPVVSFFCKYKTEFDENGLNKAFKMLLEREPIISKKCVLLNNGDCALENIGFRMSLEFVENEDALNFYNEKRTEYINPFKGLFKFCVVNNRYLIILCHICVGDVKSLAMLSGELMGFYEHKNTNIDPKNVFLFSQKSDIPANINAFVIDKITGELELKWYKKKKHFKAENYNKYLSLCENKRDVETYSFTLSKRKTSELKAYCEEKNTDFSTLICSLFYYDLSYKKNDKKYNSVRFGCDVRLYDDKPYSLGVGPFGTYATVMMPKKKYIAKSGKEKAFHDEVYKKVTSPFCAYYDDLFLVNISPKFCDASEFYTKNLCKIKCAKKLAKNYGCLNKKKLKFDFYNFDVVSYKDLSCFDDVQCNGNFAIKDDFYVSAVLKNGETQINITADKKIYGGKLANICNRIVTKADNLIKYIDE